MNLKTKYLYHEFGNFFVLTLLIFILLFMVRPFLWFMDIIINHFFTIGTVGKFFIYSLFEVSPDIIALSFFTAVIGNVARMNMDREYWVFLISGISGRQILKFFIFAGLIFCFVEFWLCFFITPSAIYKNRLLIRQARIDEPMKMFKPKSIIKKFPGISIYVDNIKGRTLHRIYISQKMGSDTICAISAEEGKIQLNTDGYLYLLLENGSIVSHSIKKSRIVLKTLFKEYSFLLPYRVVSDFNVEKRPKEMNLFLLIRNFSRQSDDQFFMVIFKKIFFVLLPIFYLFIGFYAGIGSRMHGYMHILGIGLLMGLLSYFIILVGEGIVYKTGNTYLFFIVPLIFLLLVVLLRKRFSNVI